MPTATGRESKGLEPTEQEARSRDDAMPEQVDGRGQLFPNEEHTGHVLPAVQGRLVDSQ